MPSRILPHARSRGLRIKSRRGLKSQRRSADIERGPEMSMYQLPRGLVFAIFALTSLLSPSGIHAAEQGGIRGAIADGSDAALPGVTVVAASNEGRVLATTTTDGAGAYSLDGLPAGEVKLAFQLAGFVTASVSVAVEPGAVTILQRRLELAPVTETVLVVGEAPVASTASAPVAPPRPVAQPIPVHDRASICGPAKPAALPESFGTIQSGRLDGARDLYTKDDEVLIDGGTADGLEAGQNVVVRRRFRVREASGDAIVGEHTAGVLQIVTADERTSSAVVVYACDELRKGDFLASFKPEPLRTPEPAGIPSFDEAAKILFGDAGEMLGAPGRLMVIDRGSDRGLRVGQRVTLFRRTRQTGNTPSLVGDAVIVAIRGDSATIRVEGVSDAVSAGDWAAPQQSLPVVAAAGSRAGSR
jgi:Carboxypeptidase regulatory-like domain